MLLNSYNCKYIFLYIKNTVIYTCLFLYEGTIRFPHRLVFFLFFGRKCFASPLNNITEIQRDRPYRIIEVLRLRHPTENHFIIRVVGPRETEKLHSTYLRLLLRMRSSKLIGEIYFSPSHITLSPHLGNLSFILKYLVKGRMKRSISLYCIHLRSFLEMSEQGNTSRMCHTITKAPSPSSRN